MLRLLPLLLVAGALAEQTLEEREYGIPPAEVSEYAPTSGRLLKEVTKPKRKFCNTSAYALKGDYAYEACGAFCKQAKAPNHCKFCKCRACSFCKAAAAATLGKPASTKADSSTPAGSASTASGATSSSAAAPKRKKKGAGLGGKKKGAGASGGKLKLGGKKKAKKAARKLRQTSTAASTPASS
jgi:hypothetical protein